MRFGIPIALLCLTLSGPALAQGIPRIKARIISFDGKVMTVSSGTAGQTLTIGLRPDAQFMYEEKTAALAIKPGDYLGATLAKSAGRWQAQEAHIFPESLRGANDGLYPLPSAPDQDIASGTVASNDPQSGLITLAFHGSVGSDGPTCTGRAPRQGGCKGEVAFTMAPNAGVVAIKPGDKSIIVPGKVAAISVIAGPDGHLVTLGLTIENETGGEVSDRPQPKPPAPPAK